MGFNSAFKGLIVADFVHEEVTVYNEIISSVVFEYVNVE